MRRVTSPAPAPARDTQITPSTKNRIDTSRDRKWNNERVTHHHRWGNRNQNKMMDSRLWCKSCSCLHLPSECTSSTANTTGHTHCNTLYKQSSTFHKSCLKIQYPIAVTHFREQIRQWVYVGVVTGNDALPVVCISCWGQWWTLETQTCHGNNTLLKLIIFE